MRITFVAGVCAAAVLLGSASFSATALAQSMKSDGRVDIAGRTVACRDARVTLDRNIPSEGAAGPGHVILNPRLLRSQPDSVRLFVFHHECGHLHVGNDELKADCWAIDRGVRDGWLDRDGIQAVCRSFDGVGETETHPSAMRRCRNLDRCFATSMAATAKQRVASTVPAPRLVKGPTLVSSGIVRYTSK